MNHHRITQRDQSDSHHFNAALHRLAQVLGDSEHPHIPKISDPLIQTMVWIANRFEIESVRLDALVRDDTVTLREQLFRMAEILGVGIREVELPTESGVICGNYLVFESGSNQPAVLLAEPNRPHLWTPNTQHTEPFSGRLTQFKSQAFQLYAPLPRPALRWIDFIKFGFSHSGSPKQIVIFSTTVLAILGLVFPISLGFLVDHIIPEAELRPLMELIGWLLLVVMNMSLFQWARAVILLRASAGMDNALQSGLWLRILQTPLPFFRMFSVGDLTQRANSIPEIRRVVSVTQISLLISALFSLSSIIILAVLDWKLCAQLLLMLIPVTLGFGTVLWVQIKGAQDIGKWESRLTGLFIQLMRGISKLNLANAQRRAFSVWATGFSAQKSLVFRLKKHRAVIEIFSALLPSIGLFLLFLNFGLVKNHSFSIGQFVIFSAALGQGLGAVSTIFSVLLTVSPMVGSAKLIMPILAQVPEAQNRRNYLTHMTGAIEVVQVRFSYPNMPPLIQDVSFKIEPGQFVAIVGPSGSGKSTLLRLLLGFEEPQSGMIYVDGIPLSSLDLSSVRRHFGVVLQQSELFSGDIKSNILGTSSQDIDLAWQVAKIAGLEADIRAMPMGMHTLISDTASTLSGGQKQRLTLARALVNHPKCLFLDEATSALDNATQFEVSERLNALSMTRIVIAHRLSTIRNADLIIVMSEGRVVQRGTFESLMNEPGVFQQLAGRQI